MTANGATAGSSPGRGLMVDPDRASQVRTVSDKDTQARQSPFQDDDTCDEPFCTNPATPLGDYCRRHSQGFGGAPTPSRDPPSNPQPIVTGFDDDQLNRIERKLDALLKHLGEDPGEYE